MRGAPHLEMDQEMIVHSAMYVLQPGMNCCCTCTFFNRVHEYLYRHGILAMSCRHNFLHELLVACTAAGQCTLVS